MSYLFDPVGTYTEVFVRHIELTPEMFRMIFGRA